MTPIRSRDSVRRGDHVARRDVVHRFRLVHSEAVRREANRVEREADHSTGVVDADDVQRTEGGGYLLVRDAFLERNPRFVTVDARAVDAAAVGRGVRECVGERFERVGDGDSVGCVLMVDSATERDRYDTLSREGPSFSRSTVWIEQTI
ncbi:hypothetical protein [Halogeometricum limi]|uniref:hypothetical protein n=1 Tax=Halogeometricum limi TaxID=555875 RepID=UPI001587816F|nr:hypothetical protein [Halogeometricum limi]